MEPRARAGKNVGKMNFNHVELAQMLYGHGDTKAPLPETVRVLDEIATDFIQSISFEATRAAHHAGRQKVKLDDFHFAMRRNPAYMGRIQEVFEKKKEIETARKGFALDEAQIAREEKEKAAAAAAAAAAGGTGGKKGAATTGPSEEEQLDEADDDVDADADIGTSAGRKR